MRNRGKLFISMASIALLGFVGLPALAYRGDYAKQGPNYSAERHEQMQNALESGNYNAWKELMNGRGRITEKITAENFARFAEAYKLAKEGKYEEANKIRQELGLRTGNGGGGNGECTCPGGKSGYGRGSGWNRS